MDKGKSNEKIANEPSKSGDVRKAAKMASPSGKPAKQ